MKTMRKVFVTILLMAAFFGLKAQEPLDYTQKLDSVVGSSDFDWSRYKKIFTYYVDDAVIQDDTYSLEEGEWKLSGGNVYQYSPDFQQILGAIALTVDDTVMRPTVWTQYEYDDLDHLTLVMNYMAGDTSWVENSKYEYHYDADGLLDTCLYSTIRNGNWRESERSIYSYNDDQQCVSLLAQRKGGWGPFANNWMDSYRYDLVYENGELVSELYYTGGGGWFGGGEMVLDSKIEYEFDANGNLINKTASINNDGKEWIVRDVFENQYNTSIEASAILGMEAYWDMFLKNGMGYASGVPMPLKNGWKSCSVISSNLDTEFTLYCSGFAQVNEQPQEETFRAYSVDGRLVVENLEPADVMVYDMLGHVVASKNQTLQCEFNLTPGLYIVNNGKTRMKVIVK